MFYPLSLFVGIVLFLVSSVKLFESISFIKNGQRAIGKVVEIEKHEDSEGGHSYTPIFSFETLTHKEVIYRYHTASSPSDWQIGDEATIVYDAQQPDDARLLTYFGVFRLSIILMAFAMPMIALGGGYYLAQPLLK